MTPGALEELAATLAASPGLSGKTDIRGACRALGLSGGAAVPAGDDCAALADGDGWLLYAVEGFMNGFVERDPWFAGWCSVMVNVSDVAAMGGRPTAIVDALWAPGAEAAAPVLAGMRAASAAYGVPIVGGHTNLRSERLQLAVSVIGRADALITSFDARPGDVLIAAVDHRGAWRPIFDNWQAALDAPADRLRADLEILPLLAEHGLCRAGKDISQGGIPGTALMLAECSGVGVDLDLDAIPLPQGVALERWLRAFPSFGFLLSVAPGQVDAVVARFVGRGVSAAAIGRITPGGTVTLTSGGATRPLWDHAADPYLGFAMAAVHA